MMRMVGAGKIRDAVSRLAIEANLYLRRDVFSALKRAYSKEKAPRAKKILKALIDNAAIASSERIPICQDTGMAAVFMEIGQEAAIVGGDLEKAVNEGVAEGYKKGFLRKSIVADPLSRINTNDNTPAVIHVKIVPGDKIKITVAPKGFGSENKSLINMFRPTDGADKIEKFILEAVKKAGPDACPPYIIGVGIGGTLDKACILAKEALLRRVDKRNPRRRIAKLESGLLRKINKLNIGPMGLGGRATCLGLNIEVYPTHIAGLPVCVGISCHATRSATAVI